MKGNFLLTIDILWGANCWFAIDILSKYQLASEKGSYAAPCDFIWSAEVHGKHPVINESDIAKPRHGQVQGVAWNADTVRSLD